MIKHPFEHQFCSALKQYHQLIQKDYLNHLSCGTLCHCHDKPDSILLFKINKLTASTTSEFFTYVFNALASLQITLSFILENTSGTLNFYVGLNMPSTPTIGSEIFTQGLLATFPNSKIQAFNEQTSHTLLHHLFDPQNFCSITSTIVIPNNTSNTSSILDHLTTLLSHENYVAVFLAEPMCPDEVKDLLEHFILLFDTFSQFQQANLNCSKGVAHNQSCTLGTTDGSSCSNACTHSNSSTESCSTATYNNISPSTAVPLGDSCRTINMGVTFNNATSNSQSNGQTYSNCDTNSHSKSSSESNMNATNLTDNTGFTYTKQNKIAATAVSQLTELINRLTTNSNNPLFCFNAFFLAPHTSTTIRAGYTYTGLAKDTTTNLEPTFITTWSSHDDIYCPLLNELKHLHMPQFNLPQSNKCFKACTAITTTELLNTFYFPSPSSNLIASSSPS